jgi:hypothetical protein
MIEMEVPIDVIGVIALWALWSIGATVTTWLLIRWARRTTLQVRGSIAKEVRDTKEYVDTKFKALEERLSTIDTGTADIEEILDDRLQTLREELGAELTQRVQLATENIMSKQASAFNAFLEQAGLPDALEQELAARIQAADIRTGAMAQILATKMPKKYAQKYPMLAALWENYKLQLLRELQTATTTTEATSSNSSGFKPGL